MNKFNPFVSTFYSGALHASLDEGKFCKAFNKDFYVGGVYIVKFAAFPSNKNKVVKSTHNYNKVVKSTYNYNKNNDIELVYNYKYYPSIFINSIVGYLLTRTDFGNSFSFRDWGDFYSVIDKSLIVDNFMRMLVNDGSIHNDHYQELYIRNQSFTINIERNWDDFYMLTFDLLKRSTDVKELGDLVKILNMITSKKYFELFCERSPGYRNHPILPTLKVPTQYYLLKDCLFVVKDLESFLDMIKKEYNYTINKGNIKTRAEVNTLASFLSCFDGDYRESLYNYQKHLVNIGFIPWQSELPRSKFQHRNVHMNLGSVKYYSTKRIINVNTTDKCYSTKSIINISLTDKYHFTKIITNINIINKYYSTKTLSKEFTKNKQELFEENYYQVSNILEKNGYVGTEKTQEEIEWLLLQQEDMFSDMKKLKTKLMYNDETFKLIQNKYKTLCNLVKSWLKTIKNKQTTFQIASLEYHPLIKTVIKELGYKNVASIILSYFMYILTNPTLTEKAALDKTIETPGIRSNTAFEHLGREIFNKYLYSLYKKSDIYKKGKALYKTFKDKHKSDPQNSYIYENGNFNAKFGGEFVGALLSVELLIIAVDDDPTSSKKKTDQYLRVKDDIRKIFLKNNFKVYHLPQRLPMIYEPKDYKYNSSNEEIELGGYLLNGEYFVSELIKHKIGHEKNSELKEDNIIIDMVNRINKTPFKINLDTLSYVRRHGYDKGIITDSSNKDIESFMNNPYKRLSKKDKNKYRSILSKILMERNILSIAITFSKMDTIYFPVRLEFRGRVLCSTEFFDFQKNDLAKGLISFARPGEIRKTDSEAIKYFKGYGANMYGHGLDKRSLNYRAKWVDDNSEKLLNFEENDIVDSAENKACFISFCFEYKRFIQYINDINSVIFYTYLPIQLDATCNGYQHLALLTKEINILGKLNLDKASHEDDPNDFYKFTSIMLKSYIDSEINRVTLKLSENNEINIDNKGVNTNINVNNDSKNGGRFLDSENYLRILKLLKEVDLGRAILKYLIMKQSYRAGIKTLVKDILSDPDFEQVVEGGYTIIKGKKIPNIHYIYKNSLKITYGDLVTYVFALKQVIKLVAPKIDKLIKYLDNVVAICTKLKMSINWVTVSGLEVRQSYMKEKDYKIPAFTFTKTRYTFKEYLAGEYDYKKQLRASMPNFIHALDASVVALLYKSLQGIDLYTVHDCFAVTADNVPRLINDLQLAYVDIYVSNDYLLKFDKHLRSTIYNERGEKVLENVNDKYINISDGEKIPFPNVMEVIEPFDNDNLKERIKYAISHAIYVAI